MRFAELELLKFGRFEDCRLRFPQGARDLHVVVGNNEAGKTTTMAAIANLLFGFPHTTPYDFRFDKKLLRVGALLQDGEVALACRRRSGRTGTLSDPAGKVLDDAVLAGMLAGYGTDSFHRMFSLDHARLREGGQAILAARDDVGQAIFAAGSGLVGVAALLATLEEEARQIWAPRRAADRRYHAAEKTYDEARARQKAAQIRPAAWDDLRQELARLDGLLAVLRARRQELERERADVERRRRVLPHAALLRRAREDLALLGEIHDLPADAAATQAEVATALAMAEAEARSARTEREQVLAALEPLVVDIRLLDLAGEIEAFRETKGAIDKSLADLPRRQAELSLRRRRLGELQHELGWPAEGAAALRSRLPQRVGLVQLRDLLERRGGLDGILAGAVDGEDEARQALRRVQVRQDGLPAVRDLGDLRAALKAARAIGDIEGAIHDAQREAARRQAALAVAIGKLAPWMGTPNQLRALVLPDESELAAVLTDAAQAETALAEARRAHEAEVDQRAVLELKRAQLLDDALGVPPEAVAEARRRRDDVWRAVRGHVLGSQALDDPRRAADDFEQRSGEADATADRRYASAEHSARLSVLQHDLERNALAVEQQGRVLAQAEAVAGAMAAAWRERLGGPGFQMAPKAYGIWAERRRRALQLADEVEKAEENLDDLSRRRLAAAERLAKALGAAEMPPAAGLGFPTLIETAERVEETAAGEIQQRRDLAQQQAAAIEAAARAAAKKAAAERELTHWQSDWLKAIASVGLNAAAGPAMIRAQLDLIEEVRSAVEEIGQLEHRIEAIGRDVDGFAVDVRDLAARCGLETADLPPGDLLARLARAARQASDVRARRTGLEGQLDAVDRRLRDTEAAGDRALARLQPLTGISGITDPALLADAIGRSDRARTLRQECDRLIQEIISAGGGLGLDALLAESAGAEPVKLVVRGEELQAEIAALSDQIALYTGERATVQGNFARLDGGPDAAIAAADAEQARAEMAAQAESYVRKRAEVALLRWSIGRYRAEKQTPLLKRASELFSRLTLGRYTELLVDLDGDKARLAGLDRDQSVVPAEGMSEGTVDQLFLALRLAAVEDTVAAGARLPFLADDLFINYDDDRARAGFEVLAELAGRTQVLFFTHHQHLAALAQTALRPIELSTCSLV